MVQPIEIPRTFLETAVFQESENVGDHYYHFGIHPKTASLYGNNPDEIVYVRLEVIEGITIHNRPKDNKVDYWGWWDYKQQRLIMIYPSWISFYVCFPGGVHHEEERGDGKALNLKVRYAYPYNTKDPEDSIE